MAIIREPIGTGKFFGIEIPFMFVKDEAGAVLYSYTLPIFASATGGFLVFGILIAIVNMIGKKKGKKMRKEFSCATCPSAAICGKTSCPEMLEVAVDLANNGNAAANADVKEGGENAN